MKSRYLKFLVIAESYASLSKDQRKKVGAVALDDDCTQLSEGYNGMPRGVNDNVTERHEKPEKDYWMAHAEENVVAQAARKGVSLVGSTVIVTTLFPCHVCSRLMIQAGVARVVAPKPREDSSWNEKQLRAVEMLLEANVEIHYLENADGT